MEPSLPFQVVQHDSLRMGLPALKEEALPKHPVEEIQESSRAQVRGCQIAQVRAKSAAGLGQPNASCLLSAYQARAPLSSGRDPLWAGSALS